MRTLVSDTREMTEEQFVAARRSGIFSTDIPALLNLSKYKSALQVYLEKIGEASATIPTERMMDGHMIEVPLIDRFMKETGCRASPMKVMGQHYKHDVLCSNFDAEVWKEEFDTEKGILEIKGCGSQMFDEWDESPPAYYHAQAMHQLLVSGREWGYLYAWAWGSGTKCYRIEADEDFFHMIIEASNKFWTDHVLKKIPPLGDEYFVSSEDLRLLYPRVEREEATLDDSIDPWLEMWDAGTSLAKKGEDMREQAKVEIMKQMKGAARGLRGNRKINWSLVNQSRFDSKNFKEKEPKLYEKYLLKGEGRRFSITESKANREEI